MKRENFISAFLGALGASDITLSAVRPDSVLGTVIYNANDPEDKQSFCWHSSESEAPSENVCNLVRLIQSQSLLDIDRLKVSREELCSIYNKNNQHEVSQSTFDKLLNALLEIRVDMIDDGEETDSYLIHE